MDGNKLNISTVEDPIEYQLAAANQVQVHDKIGMTFSAALRSLLRQDPTWCCWVKFATRRPPRSPCKLPDGSPGAQHLHTNDAPASITRLVNIGVEPYLISAAVNAVLAQRLIAQDLPAFKKEYEPTAEMKEFLMLQGHVR